MPRGDKTGPEGKGPQTGRGVGGCSDINTTQIPIDVQPRRQRLGIGRRLMRRLRRGFGRRNQII